MAVPDPDMDEMCLMAYESKPRACKDLYRVPRRGDFIEVLWCLDHLPGLPNKWCIAEVLHVSGSPEQDCLAAGVLLYMPGETWSEQVHRVEFLDNYKIRRDTEAYDDNLDSKGNENPELDWQFSAHLDNNSDRSDEDWNAGTSDTTPTHQDAPRAEHNSQLGFRNEVEINSLRSGYASLTVEVQKLKREVVKQSHSLAQVQTSHVSRQSCTGAACVFPRLRHRLALRMQAVIRPITSTLQKRGPDESEQTIAPRAGDGLHVGVLKARTECTLQQFENLARQVRATVSSGSVAFVPEFSYTQLPLQSSSAFRILFSTFSELADQIGLHSTADKLEMVRKCGTGPQGDLLRILATYSLRKDDPSGVARIYLRTSCGDAQPGETSERETEAAQLYPVLTRKTREWNIVDRSFVHGLQTESVTLPNLNNTTSELQAFALHWKRGADLSHRTWSRSLIDPAQVFGWLDASLPFIQTQGRHICTEVGGSAADDVWDRLLCRES